MRLSDLAHDIIVRHLPPTHSCPDCSGRGLELRHDLGATRIEACAHCSGSGRIR